MKQTKRQSGAVIDSSRAHQVRDLLQLLGWTHEKAAQQLGVHRVTVSRWATGATMVPDHQIKHLELRADVVQLQIKVAEGADRVL